MDKFIKPSRLVFCAFIMVVLLIIYCLTLYKLQIIEGEEYLESSTGTISSTVTVHSSRGSIYDRNGELLVSDRTVYNVMISRKSLLKQDDPNDIVRRLISAASLYGVSYNDSCPITKTAPFEYDASATDTQLSRLNAYFNYFSKQLDPDMSAQDLVTWLRSHYGISYTVPAEEARKIIGIRYELEMRAIINTSDYVFAEDVSTDFITYLSEQDFPCVSIETSSVRQYHTSYAAHLLGYVAQMSSEEYQEKYKELGYPYNSYVGKNGVEYAFEEYLHGTDGKTTTYTDSTGAVTDVVVESEATAGNDVYLTIDIGLQEQAEASLASTIVQMNAERGEDEEKAEGGAVVAIDVRTGDVLAMASYPTFDLATFSQNTAALFADTSKPLFNRATYGTYNPGSTFKMVTALAGLKEGIISRWTLVEDEGIFKKYEDVGYTPRCWIYPSTHGVLDIVGALENSCNYFFYWLSDQMDIDEIAETAQEFGFGASTGIEIGDSSGKLATREYKMEATGESGWWKADTLITSIGQGLNMFTPIQIANYVAAIANGGTLYSDTVLKYVADFNGEGIVYESEPTVLNKIDNSQGYFSILQEGMRAVASTGTASSTFGNYPISVAAKTGTVQSDNTSMNTGVFVCYAPADDPQIAIAVVVEKGGSGSALTTVAKDLMDVYFSSTEISETTATDNSLAK